VTTPGRKAVFLDRDGVLNRPIAGDRGGERPPWRVSELELLPGVETACSLLRASGALLVVVTNQPDIGHGRVGRSEVTGLNDRLAELLSLDAVYMCPHPQGVGCPWRKPAPGMLQQAAADLRIDFAVSWLVGDRWVDIAAGRAVGVKTVLVRRVGSWDATSAGPPPPGLFADVGVAGLLEAVPIIGSPRSGCSLRA